MMQWMWKQCVQAPQTSGQSSPGLLQSGQQPSKATLKNRKVLEIDAEEILVKSKESLLAFTDCKQKL